MYSKMKNTDSNWYYNSGQYQEAINYFHNMLITDKRFFDLKKTQKIKTKKF